MRKLMKRSAKKAVRTAAVAGAVVAWSGVVSILYINMLIKPENSHHDFYF